MRVPNAPRSKKKPTTNLARSMPNYTVEMAMGSSENNIPEVYVAADMLMPMKLDHYKKYRKKRPIYYDKVYEIDGTIFREEDFQSSSEEEDNGVLKEFEIETYGTYSAIFEGIDIKHLRVSIKNTSSGFIINSKVLLTLEQWNTVMEYNGSHKCLVCDTMICDANVHVESDDHKENLEKYQPLEIFDLSITRSIRDKYHCGVCNEAFYKYMVNDHFYGENHDEKMLLATKRACDVMTGSGVRDENATINIEKPKQNKIDNGNINKDCHHVDRKRRLINSEARGTSEGGFVATRKEQENQISYAEIAKRPVATPEYLYVSLVNYILRIKYDHWHLIITFKSKKNYCMICKKHLGIAGKTTHCAELGHLTRLNSLTFNKDYPFIYIRQIDASYFHCGICNNLHLIEDISFHVETKHSKTTPGQFLELIPINDKGLENIRKRDSSFKFEDLINIETGNLVVADPEKCATINAVSEQFSNISTATDINTINYENQMQMYANNNTYAINENNDNLATGNWYNENNTDFTDEDTQMEYEINNENPNIYNDVLITQFGFRVRVSFIAYNLVCPIQNGYFYCHICHESACFINMNYHINDAFHIQRLRRIPFQNNCGINLIRMVRLQNHCAICNITFKIDATKNHVFEAKHVKLLNKALEFANIQHSVFNAPINELNKLPINPPVIGMNQWSLPQPQPIMSPQVLLNQWQMPQQPIPMHQMPIIEPTFGANQWPTLPPTRSELSWRAPPEADLNRPAVNPMQVNTNQPTMTPKMNSPKTAKEQPKISESQTNINQIGRTEAKSDMHQTKNDKSPPEIVVDQPTISQPKPNIDQRTINVPKLDMDESKNDISPKIVMNEPNITVPKSDVDDSINDMNPKIVMNEPNIPKSDMNQPKIDLTKRNDSTTTLNINGAKTNVEQGATSRTEIDKNLQTTIDSKKDLNKTTTSQPKRTVVCELTFNFDNPKNDINLTKIVVNQPTVINFDTNINYCTSSVSKLDVDQPKLVMNPPKIDLNERKGSKTTLTVNKAKMNMDLHTTSQTEINKNNQTFIDPKIDMNNKPTISKPKTNTKQRTISSFKSDVDRPKNVVKPPKIGLNKRKGGTTTSAKKAKIDVDRHTSGRTEIDKKNLTFIDLIKDMYKSFKSNKKTESTVDMFDSNKAIRDAAEDFEYFNEKFVYLKFKNAFIQVSLLSYNSLVDTGSGLRYCFVCSVHVYTSLKSHVESANHTKCMDECKFVKKYHKHFLRQILSYYHCSLCNIILTSNDISKHIIWSLHAAEKRVKKIKRNKIKSGSKIEIVKFQTKNNSGEDDEIAVLYKVIITSNALPAEAMQKNKIITYNDKIFKITWDLYHGLVKHRNGNRCLLCASDVRTYELSAHISGECHKLKVDKFETRHQPHLIRKVNESTLNCVVCNIEIASKEHIVTEHVCSKKHRKNFEAMLIDNCNLESYADCIMNLPFN